MVVDRAVVLRVLVLISQSIWFITGDFMDTVLRPVQSKCSSCIICSCILLLSDLCFASLCSHVLSSFTYTACKLHWHCWSRSCQPARRSSWQLQKKKKNELILGARFKRKGNEQTSKTFYHFHSHFQQPSESHPCWRVPLRENESMFTVVYWVLQEEEDSTSFSWKHNMDTM